MLIQESSIIGDGELKRKFVAVSSPMFEAMFLEPLAGKIPSRSNAVVGLHRDENL
jgi:hypothetical protein